MGRSARFRKTHWMVNRIVNTWEEGEGEERGALFLIVKVKE